MQIIITLDDTVDNYQAEEIAKNFETEYPFIFKAETRARGCGKCSAKTAECKPETAGRTMAAIAPTTEQSAPRCRICGDSVYKKDLCYIHSEAS